MSILEELWYGNIEPAEYDSPPSKEYKEMLQLICRNEDKLLATMTDAQKESTIFPFCTFTAPISMMRFLRGLRPVVSKSTT